MVVVVVVVLEWWQDMATGEEAGGATYEWYRSHPNAMSFLVGSALAYAGWLAGWRELRAASGRLARFLLGAGPMTSVLACEFHMLPKTCAWPSELVMARARFRRVGMVQEIDRWHSRI
jgi:hypothetical protein